MKNWIKQLLNLTKINFYGYFREPAIIFWALVFPAGIAGVLGIAFQGTPPATSIAIVVDYDREPAHSINTEANLVSTYANRLETISRDREGTGALNIELMTEEEAKLALKRGSIQLYARMRASSMEELADYAPATADSRGLRQNTEDGIQAYFDPNNPEARLALLSLERSVNILLEGPKRLDPVTARPLEEIGGRYIDFLIPGLLALGVMNSCMWGVGYGLIDLRVKKLLRRMAASPMHKSAFLASHLLARMVFTFCEAFILFGFSHLLFGVRIEGSLTALAVLMIAGNFAWSGIGILCSFRGQSMHAANGIVNAVTLPLTMLSGIFFSYQNFPEWSHTIIQWLPLTLLADSVRAIFIEGAGWASIALPAVALTFTGLLAAAIGLRFYRWH